MTKSRGIYGRPAIDRLYARAVRDDATGCLVWPGPVNWNGYGRIYDHRIRGYVTIHRLAYVETKGAIPDGLEIDHLCRNTRCVNPEHLEPVTCQENMRRRSAAMTHCRRGHEFTDENTYLYRGKRNCRACQAERSRVYMGRAVVSAEAARILDR